MSSIQQANQVLNAKERGFVEGVISTTELYVKILSNQMLWGNLVVKEEVIKNLTSLGMFPEDIEYWIEEYFLTEEDK